MPTVRAAHTPRGETYDPTMRRQAKLATHIGDRPARLAATLAAALAITTAAACTDGQATAPTNPPTTNATTATTAPPTTSTSTTTPAPTTSATTAPSTTIDEATIRANIEQAYFDALDAYDRAIQNPADSVSRERLRQSYVDPNLGSILATLDRLVEEGAVAQLNLDLPNAATILEGPVLLPDNPNRADLVVCEVRTDRYVKPGAGPGGVDVLVSDEIVVARILARMELVDGTWRSRSGERLANLATPDDCESTT